MLLCNGPGTCIPICFVTALFDLIRLQDTRIVFIESVCRVKKLSLTGYLLYYMHITDLFFVHWDDLAKKYPRSKLISRTATAKG